MLLTETLICLSSVTDTASHGYRTRYSSTDSFRDDLENPRSPCITLKENAAENQFPGNIRSLKSMSADAFEPAQKDLTRYIENIRRRYRCFANYASLINSRTEPTVHPVAQSPRVIVPDITYLFMVRSKLKARREGRTSYVIVAGSTRLFIITCEREEWRMRGTGGRKRERKKEQRDKEAKTARSSSTSVRTQLNILSYFFALYLHLRF